MSTWTRIEAVHRAGIAGISVLLLASSVLAAPSPERLRERIGVLASDEFEGRLPGTAGEEKSVTYLVNECKKIGLEPGNPDGTYLQTVPLVGIRSTPTVSFSFADKKLDLLPVNEFIAETQRTAEHVEVKDSEVVFVGYGVVAPEYNWDDFKGVDVRGKTVLMLVNDPPVPDPADPSKLDAAVFRGNAMTYYGRWTYKYESALAHGAAACLIVHETGPAGYPFAVLSGGFYREHFSVRVTDEAKDLLAVQGWLTVDAAKKIFTAAGQDFAALKVAAARRDFRPVALLLKANLAIENHTRDIVSKNVAAKLTGTDPKLRDEYVIYTAHWDHLGRDTRLSGDQIFNGADDNASGCAALLEIAQTFAQLPADRRPKRSLLFLCVTAEEQGLLGSHYYATHPLYPLKKTVANINMDGMNLFAPTHDIEVIGAGATTIEDVAREVAAQQKRVLTADSQPEKGFYFRSDQFEFARVGVPSFYTKSGREAIGRAADYIDQKRADYLAHDYHRVSDEVKPDWDYSAAAQDVEFLMGVGDRLADYPRWPEWKPGSEFKAARDATLKE